MKKFVPTFNSVSTIDYSIVGNFRLFESIYSGLPYGYVDIIDSSGDIIEKFPNIQIGANLDFDFICDQDDIELKLPKFVVLDIQFGDNSQTLKGIIRVWFGHRLFLFKDTSNHAYPPMKRSELFKKVLKDKTRGFEIKIEDKNFIKSDDAGDTPEYKCCKDDWEFLTQELLPKTCCQQLPVYLFTNIEDKFFLKTFRSLYKSNANVGLFPTEINDTSADAESNLKGFANKHKTILHLLGIKSKINGRELLSEFHPVFYADSSKNGKMASGYKTPLNVNADDGTPLEKFLPLDFKVSINQGSSIKEFLNDSLEDNLQKLFSDTKNLDRVFTIESKVNFSGKIKIGDPIDLYLKSGHWANGKWIVSKSIIMTDDENGALDSLVQSIELIRPSFYGDKNECTLESTAFLTEVK